MISKNKEENKVINQGGMFFKYKVLIDSIKNSYPGSNVTKRSNTSIAITFDYREALTVFTINQGYGEVHVFWSFSSFLYDNLRLNWKFPEDMPQEQMVSKIETDLMIFHENLLNGM